MQSDTSPITLGVTSGWAATMKQLMPLMIANVSNRSKSPSLVCCLHNLWELKKVEDVVGVYVDKLIVRALHWPYWQLDELKQQGASEGRAMLSHLI